MGDGSLQRTETISYDKLYRMWEQNNWAATTIDFSADERHWSGRLDETQRRGALWNYGMFLVGEEAVERTLTPLIDAAPLEEQRAFLTTQIVDETRHHIFFSRFLREVAGLGHDPVSTLAAADGLLTWGFKQVFAELDRVTGELHRKPKDLPLLAQAVAIYHIVVEGMLAIPGQHFIQRYVRKMEILPGFCEGIDNVSRDESRHVAFGVKFLGDLVRESDECRAAAIELWDRALRWAVGVFIPPDRDPVYAECFGFSLEEIYAFGLRSFETKVRRAGIDPQEIPMLKLDTPDLSYEERSQRIWKMIDARFLGDDREAPKPTRETMQIIFDQMARMADASELRKLGGAVEWRLPHFGVWHIYAIDGSATAAEGPAPEQPVLRIESSAADLALVSVKRLTGRKAVLTRRFKPKGSFRALMRLERVFPI